MIKSAFKALNILKNKNINILIVGASGSGKSETINALLKDAKITDQTAIAKSGSDSVTMDIKKFKIGTCTVYDSPGLGDLEAKDAAHVKKIKSLLFEVDKNGNLVIDLVIVILNGSNLRDKAVWQKLINEVLIPTMQNPEDLIIAINKIDLFDDGDYWDKRNNKPTKKLREYIELEIENSIKQQIKVATNIEVEPIYYSAGRKERNKKPWNLVALYEQMNEKAPKEKKISLARNISDEKENYENGDNVDEKFQEIKENLVETVLEDIDLPSDNNQESKESYILSNQLNNNVKSKKKKKKKKKESSGWLGSLISGAISFFTGWW